MVSWIDWKRAKAVVEYGPGLGAITQEVLKVKRPATHLFVIEKEPAFVEKLRERFPGLTVYQRCALEVQALCQHEGIEGVDAIVSGLPWAAFSAGLQSSLLDAMMKVLRPGGQFATFAYLHGLMLPAGQRFRRLLDSYFEEVAVSPVVWRNLPPAVVYRCRRGQT